MSTYSLTAAEPKRNNRNLTANIAVKSSSKNIILTWHKIGLKVTGIKFRKSSFC